ncbi:N-acetyltransferase, partial [Sulfurimonas sp. SAG-AH-194-L11]
KIWHFCHLDTGAIVGENCNLGQGVYIGQSGIVGNACRLGNNVAIFSNVILEDFVFCAPYMVFTHISFPRACISRKDIFDKTLVKTGATLGANSSIIPGVTIGMGAFVGAGAVVTKSCPDWSLVVGTPAKHIGWVSAYGNKIPLPLSGYGEWVCANTNDKYILNANELTRVPGEIDILEYRPAERYNRLVVKNEF